MRAPGKPRNTSEALWRKVDVRGADECWPWKGWKNERGYGRTEINDVTYFAHRVIYDLAYPGRISLRPGSNADSLRHSCDNPSCCNPAHLVPGTHLDNMRDKAMRGRSPDFRGAKGPRAKLTDEDVFDIRLHKKYGATLNALALLYDVSRATISGVLYGRHYRAAA